MNPRFANTPSPPYYAVIFTSTRTSGMRTSGADSDGYGATAERMVELAQTMPGYLGIESVRDADGVGITVSYWSDEESIRAWRRNVEHGAAQAEGKARWYEHYELRIAKVERAYAGPEGRG